MMASIRRQAVETGRLDHGIALSTPSVIVALDPETLKQLRAAARAKRATLADIIRQAIRDQLNPPTSKRS